MSSTLRSVIHLWRSAVKHVVPLQGGFYVVTGIWPLLHIPSFLWVTGPKTDVWLVYTVGGLITVIGLSLLATMRDGTDSSVGPLLGIGSAALLASIDLYFVSAATISPIYLLDSLVEGMFIALWLSRLLLSGAVSKKVQVRNIVDHE